MKELFTDNAVKSLKGKENDDKSETFFLLHLHFKLSGVTPLDPQDSISKRAKNLPAASVLN